MLERVAQDRAAPFFLAIGTRQRALPVGTQPTITGRVQASGAGRGARAADGHSCGYPDTTLTAYDVDTKVPLMMKVPGMHTAGQRTPTLVEAVDMYPTLVELCKLPLPPQTLEGGSFVPLLRDPRRGWKKAAFNSSAPYGNVRAITTARYDLIAEFPHERGVVRPHERSDGDAQPGAHVRVPGRVASGGARGRAGCGEAAGLTPGRAAQAMDACRK